MSITLKQAVEIAKRELIKETGLTNAVLGKYCTETERGWYFDFQMDDDTAHFVSKKGKYKMEFDDEIPPKMGDMKIINEDVDISEYL